MHVAVAAGSLGLAACGDDDDDGGSGGSSGESDTLIHGTTDQPISYDPAGAYDLPSYDGIFNVPEPPDRRARRQQGRSGSRRELRLHRDKGKVFECTLKDGITFSDGSDLTAEDVVFSFERNIEIADPNGASSLLANMKSIEAKGDETVVFNLKESDATWPLLLTTGASASSPPTSTRTTSSSRATRSSAPAATRWPSTSPASRR